MHRVGTAALVIAAAVILVLPEPGFAQSQPAPIAIDYPLDGTVFPPDFATPTFIWRDTAGRATAWMIGIVFGDRSQSIHIDARGERMKVGEIDPRCIAKTNRLPELTPEQAASGTWTPDEATWAAILKRSAKRPAQITITGYLDQGAQQAVSRGQVTIQTAKEPVGAPIFYRDVPLMPSEAQKGVIKPLDANALPLIAWRLRNVSESRSRLLMDGVHTCANCHSISRDGRTMGMDVDGPANDKGLYAVLPISRHISIRQENVVAWSNFRGKMGGKLRVAFMPQISPDGRHVVATINDPGAPQTEIERQNRPNDLIGNYYVANFKDYRFLQVFYPTRGILAWYSKETGRLEPLPGADDPKYVHTNAVWSPDGKYLVFARAEAKDAYPPGGEMAQSANDPKETPIQYDLYRVPFNKGKGGKAEPVAGAGSNGMSNSFPKVSPDGKWIVFVQSRNGELMRPDSQLYIVPFKGGQARRMRCNTSLMNSWHSFSPNGRWMVFSSKSRSPYTQMYLTYLDKKGQDSPAILIEHATAANRAVNIPEFINIPPDVLEKMDAPVTEFYKVFDIAGDLLQKGEYEAAIPKWRNALELSPGDARVHNNLGVALFETKRIDEAIAEYRKALELNPDYPEAHNSLGSALAGQGKFDEAIRHFEKALELKPGDARAHTNIGAALAEMGRIDEAIPHYAKALEAAPDDAETHNNLGIALARRSRLEEAIPHLEKAVSGKPESFEFQYNAGRVLAAARRFDRAIPHFEHAARLSGGLDANVLDMLGGVYAEVGRYSEALQAARRALAIATQQGNGELVRAIGARIAVYESRVTNP